MQTSSYKPYPELAMPALGDFRVRDLRHKAASRFDEAAVSIVAVQ